MASPKTIGVLITEDGAEPGSLLPSYPVFSTWAKSTDGATWTPATPPVFVRVAGGRYEADVAASVVPGTTVSYVIDCGPDADQRLLSNSFRGEDWNDDVATSTRASATALATLQTEADAIKVKTDLIAFPGAANLLSSISGIGGVGPLLQVPIGQAFTVTIYVRDANGNPVNLSGKTVTLILGIGVPGGGQSQLPAQQLVARAAVNRSPSSLGIADAALMPADTLGLFPGGGYVYSAKTTDGAGIVAWVFLTSPVELIPVPVGG